MREPLRREFAETLYKKISQPHVPIRRSRLLLLKRLASGLAVLCLVLVFALIVSPEVRAQIAQILDSGARDYGSQLWENATMSDAQARLPFAALEPEDLPTGYTFAYALVPRHNPRSATFVYTDPGNPKANLTIWQGVSSDPADCTRALGQAPRESLAIKDHSALYVPRPESERSDGTKTLDENTNILVVEYSDQCIWIVGQRDAGVNRETLTAIAASMH